MSTIAAFESEIMMQLEFLEYFEPSKQLSIQNQQKAIFCGAGDSFVSAQLGEVFSDFRIKALDPLDISKYKRLLNDHHLYLISISGNTISNIQLARQSKISTAITANPQSKLANACDGIIHLKFDNTGIQTAGSISLLASALTCISLVTKFKMPNYHKLYKMAFKVSKKPIHGRVYVLGNLYSFPIAMFCAAKLQEVLGADARYERIEQFSHMGLFSSRKGDTVVIFEKRNKHNEKLVRQIKKCGLHPILIDPPTNDPIGQVIFFIFVSEFLSLHLAKIKNKKECFFVAAKKLRNASSSMIY
ncbi:MAG: sugar isomerase [Thaumarchaeota archaeon]|nr:sugar isomerase [Nitrososphaerota archaeon]